MNGGALWLSIWGEFVAIRPASHLAVPKSAAVVGDGTCFCCIAQKQEWI